MRRTTWLAGLSVIGLWTALGVFSTFEMRLEESFMPKQTSWSWALFLQLTFTTVWATITPGILWLARRFPIDRRPYWPYALLHFLGAAVATAIAKGMWIGVLHLYDGKPLSWNRLFWNIVYSADYCFVLYWMVLLVSHVVVYYRRYQRGVLDAARLNGELAQAQLRWLKSRLHPHFLFNALNSISALVREDPAAAERMIARLGDLLRLSLRDSSVQEVPLEVELEYLNIYLDIERTRFGERLGVEIEIEEGAQCALVPSLLLQPLVENAIRHGIGKLPEGGVVRIRAEREGRNLVLSVADNGPGLKASPQRVEEGVGLSTVRARLERLYGRAQSLVLRNSPGEGVETRIVIPFSTGKDESMEVAHEVVSHAGG